MPQSRFQRISDEVVEVRAHGVKYVARIDRNSFDLEVYKGRKRLERGNFRHGGGGESIDYELSDNNERSLRVRTRRDGAKLMTAISRNEEHHTIESDAAEHGMKLVAAFRRSVGPKTPYIRRFLDDLRRNVGFRREFVNNSRFQVYVDGDAGLALCAAICALAALQPEFLPACLVCLAETPIGLHPGRGGIGTGPV
jgi:hypothetical protein